MPASQIPSSPPGASSASLIGDAGWLPPTPARSANLGTFVGVLRPTLLTIIGLVLYLRQGWVVGNAGLLGGLALVLLTFSITGATSLSIAAIATNMRLGAGGAFAMISRALGLEAGGAIGIPLYLAQAMSVAFYMYGFAEGWLYLFPDHDRTLALWAVYVCGFGLSMVSEKLALRSQALVMFGVALALICIWSGIATADELHAPQWIGGFEDAGFWDLFAVFFPAGTGIMVGVGLSGKLREPRRSIPRGILGAWGIALGVYLLTLLWYAVIAAPADLRADPLTSIHPGRSEGALQELVRLARRQDVGFVLHLTDDGAREPPAHLKVNLWVRDQSPNWRLGLQLANLDLPLLLGHLLQRNSGGRLRLVSVIRREGDLPAGRHYLRRMRDEARLGAATELWVETGDFATRRRDAPAADVNIFGIPERVDLAELEALRADIGGICLFVHDSSQESALA